jgi:hypothetical protein
MTHVDRRRQKFLADHNLVAALGFPLKPRDDAPRTYRAPDVQRRIKVAPPPASTAPFKPNPGMCHLYFAEGVISIFSILRLHEFVG